MLRSPPKFDILFALHKLGIQAASKRAAATVTNQILTLASGLVNHAENPLKGLALWQNNFICFFRSMLQVLLKDSRFVWETLDASGMQLCVLSHRVPFCAYLYLARLKTRLTTLEITPSSHCIRIRAKLDRLIFRWISESKQNQQVGGPQTRSRWNCSVLCMNLHWSLTNGSALPESILALPLRRATNRLALTNVSHPACVPDLDHSRCFLPPLGAQW